MKGKFLIAGALAIVCAVGSMYVSHDAMAAALTPDFTGTQAAALAMCFFGVTKIESLKEGLVKIAADMRGLLDKADKEKRDLSPEEAKQFDALEAQKISAETAIAREEKVAAFEGSLNTPSPRKTTPANPAARVYAPTHARRGKLRSFLNEVVLDDGSVLSPHDAAYRAGMWLRASLYGDVRAKQWCDEHGLPLIRDAMGGNTNTGGGFLVPTEMETTIIDLRETYGVMRQELHVHPMSSEHTIIPRRKSGLTAYPVGENSEITASDKGWDQVALTARKWGVLSKYSSELSDDAIISLADDLASEIAYAFATAEDGAGFNGDGTSTYHGIRGILTKIIDGTHTASAIDAASGHDTFAEYDKDDLAKVQAALPQYALGTAKWYCSQPFFHLVFGRLAQAAGGNTKSDLSGKTEYVYNGFPIRISQKMPMSTADVSDTAQLLFGDLTMAGTMGDRKGMTLKVSDQRYFELDQLAIRGTERFDINFHDLGDNTTAGPVVALVAE